MSSAVPVTELEDDLVTFRREWLQEANTKRAAAASLPPSAATPLPPSSPPQLRPPPLAAVERALDTLELEDRHRPIKPKNAVETYHLGVVAEREGRLNDALNFYRAAFRLDPEVDRAYHRASLAASPPGRARRLPIGGVPTGDFSFQQTLQLTPDYEAETAHRSAKAVEEGLGKGLVAADEESTHPSSTAFLLNSLLRSIAVNPWVRTQAGDLAEPSPPTSSIPTLTPAEAHAQLAFIPSDPDLPLPLASLPREVLLLVLRFVCLSPVIPPPKPRVIEQPPSGPTKGRNKRRTPKEEMRLVELDMGLERTGRKGEWTTDVEALELFARTSRAARVLSLDDAIWRDLCLRTYVAPHQISRAESAAQIATEKHAGDWRRCFIEHPRIRLDGAFIAVVTYLRRGESHQAFCSPTHLITFYRYLRFYPTGLVVSLLTVDAPSAIVRDLNPSLRAKGLSIGRWVLRGDQVDCWDLEDPAVEEGSRKYSFRMRCRLRSTARGRMNKLEMLSLATENRTTLELEDVPIRPTKPFFFSKVASYAGDDWE